LKAIYATQLTPEQMLEQKRGEFERLQLAFPGYVPAEPNNAFLASIALYNELVPGFERLLAQAGGLDAFYARVKELSTSARSIRDPLLAQSP
jgi:predicted aminopeptidase